MPDDPIHRQVDRRRFFREGLMELLKPIASAAASFQSAAEVFGSTDAEQSPARTPLPLFIRPPGALPETAFMSTCSRCGDCVTVCPVQCIKIDATASNGADFPAILIDSQPCVLCDGLKCMHVCPTGALLPTPMQAIDMGTAIWQADSCVRQRGESCTICVDHCPVGSFAIELAGKKIRVHEQGCTGCGVCQHDCPTTPKSIIVQSRADRPLG